MMARRRRAVTETTVMPRADGRGGGVTVDREVTTCMSVLAPKRRVRPSDPAGRQQGDSPFAEPTAVSTIADILGGHAELASYASVLEAAAIDPELATDMSAPELAALLPTGSPFGHALRLRRLFAEVAKPRARIPQAPAWQQVGRRIAVGTEQGNLGDNMRSQQELALVIGALFLTMVLPGVLTCPESCSDGTACAALRAIDAVLWAVATAFFMAAVVSAWICLVNLDFVSQSQQAVWYADHASALAFPVGMAINGISTFPVAVGTRALTGSLGGASFPTYIQWVVFGIVAFPSLQGWLFHVKMGA